MKIHIIGAGGVGGYYCGILAKHGADITLICRSSKLDGFKNGLTIIDHDQTFTTKAFKITDDFNEVKKSDLIILTVKTHHLEEVCNSLSGKVPDHCSILTLQNGVAADLVVKKHLPKANVIAGITWLLATMKTTGVVTQIDVNSLLTCGFRDGSNQDLLLKIRDTLKKHGVKLHLSDNIVKDLWNKFIWLSNFAGMCGSTRRTIGEIVNDSVMQKKLVQAVDETIALAEALKIPMAPDMKEKINQKIERYKTNNTSAKPSLLIDLENNRKTEIDALSGTIVRLAHEIGMSVPTHEEFYRTITQKSSV